MGLNYKELIPERFRVAYDQNSGAWRILDLWHPQVANIADLTEDIPDTSPALKTISDLEMNAIIAKLDEMGWLEKIIRRKLAPSIQDAPIVLQAVSLPKVEKLRKKRVVKIIKEDSKLVEQGELVV
jgi:hypothetical protein